MVKIKNVEEKRIIVACMLCKFNREINIDYIFKYWAANFPNDFIVKRNKLRLYKHRVISSKDRAKAGKHMPDYCREYDDFLNDTCNWIKERYDIQLDHKTNYNKFIEMLTKYRNECLGRLNSVARKKHLLDNDYKVVNKTSKKKPLFMGKYALYHKNKCVYNTDYENIYNYLLRFKTVYSIDEKVRIKGEISK